MKSRDTISDWPALPAPLIRELSALSPWKGLATILLEWFVIGACILLYLRFPSWYLYPVVWFIIASRLYALYSLLHDAIHYSILRQKDWNDRISRLFLAWPLLVDLDIMRRAHLDHHRYLQTEKDPEMKHLDYPEFQFPMSPARFLRIAFLDLSGLHFIYYKILRLTSRFRQDGIRGMVFTLLLIEFLIPVLVLLVAAYFGLVREVLLFWLIPLATGYQFLNRIRLSTEHFQIDPGHPFKTRSVIPALAERLILTPHNLGYHLDHHLYPGVPFYNLPRLHAHLMELPGIREQATVAGSYSEIWKAFIRP